MTHGGDGAADAIRVVIADDHRSFGEALQIALDKEDDLTVIHVVDGGQEAVRATVDDTPDVVILDLRMPRVDGIEAARRIRDEGSPSAVVILTGEHDDLALARAIQVGARGVIDKTAPLTEVADAIRMAHRGEPLHRPDDVHRALQAARARTDGDKDLQRRVDRLTPRELEVLRAMASGASGAETAERLGMSPHTVRTHVQNILTKLGVHSKTDAVVAAIRMGKITPPDLAPPVTGTPEAGPQGPASGEPA